MKEEEFKLWVTECSRRVEAALDKHLPSAELYPSRLHQAMRYSALSGGKHFRPLLIYATGEALAIPLKKLDGLAACVEMIHAYSLVHDDLPAMDDDDLRRGKPTCHRAFDEATAILTGDALQALAFQVITRDKDLPDDAAIRLKIIDRIALAIGSKGMAGGQAIDLEAEGRNLSAAELENMHIHKTGALIRACVVAASDCYGEHELHGALDHYAKCVGLAFQIHDDVLDETGATDELGKSAGADRERDKSTYPALFGLRESQDMAGQLIDDAINSIECLGARGEHLRYLAHFVVRRRH